MKISKIKEINKIIEDTFLISENPDKEQKGYSYPCYVTKFQYECIQEQLTQQILSLIEELEGCLPKKLKIIKGDIVLGEVKMFDHGFNSAIDQMRASIKSFLK